MRESHHDYGPSSFCLFHYWFKLEGFDTFVKQTWNDAQLTEELSKIDLLLDKGEGSSTLISKRMEILKSIQDFVKLDTMELAQKAKIKWAIEGDENSKYYHEVLDGDQESGLDCGVDKSPDLMVLHWLHASKWGLFWKMTCSIEAKARWILSRRFLFLLIMRVLHISMQRVVDAGLFRGIQVGSSLQVSHLFYADDAVFMGHWSEANIDTILRRQGGQAAKKIGCAILQVPFSYLGSKVGCLMSRIQSWSEIVNNILTRLSKWKLKTLSIGGRLTLLKFVLEQSALMEPKLLKEHGEDEKMVNMFRKPPSSYGLESCQGGFNIFKAGDGFDGFIHRKMGNGVDIQFWEDKWRGNNTFQSDFPRMYALETQKNISVALKLSHDDPLCSFRRAPRAGVEELQYIQLVKIMEGITVFDSKDKWEMDFRSWRVTIALG
ncbi:hypothetical protein Tco_0716473 [Tanacetum coccineum]